MTIFQSGPALMSKKATAHSRKRPLCRALTFSRNVNVLRIRRNREAREAHRCRLLGAFLHSWPLPFYHSHITCLRATLHLRFTAPLMLTLS